jgi:hypothetical protein
MMQLASIASRPTSVTTRTPLDQGEMDADNHNFSEKRKLNFHHHGVMDSIGL